MEYAFLETLMDVMGLCLCAAAIFALLRWRAANRSAGADQGLSDKDRAAFEAILREYLPERAHPAPARAAPDLCSMGTESGALSARPPGGFMPDASPSGSPGGVESPSPAEVARTPNPDHVRPGGGPSAETPHDRLRRLVAEGRSMEEIRCRTALPENEIALALKLREKVEAWCRDYGNEQQII